MQACSRPWKNIEVGGVVGSVEDTHSLSANHVYVDAETPFLIAATSVQSPSGEEFFGITVITDPVAVRRFLEGPYPPYNRPRTLSIEQMAGEDFSPFMRAVKRVQVHRHAVTFAADVGSLVPMWKGLVIEASGITLSVSADEEIPMGIKVDWTAQTD
mgnify:CR=1 FL=1